MSNSIVGCTCSHTCTHPLYKYLRNINFQCIILYHCIVYVYLFVRLLFISIGIMYVLLTGMYYVMQLAKSMSLTLTALYQYEISMESPSLNMFDVIPCYIFRSSYDVNVWCQFDIELISCAHWEHSWGEKQIHEKTYYICSYMLLYRDVVGL